MLCFSIVARRTIHMAQSLLHPPIGITLVDDIPEIRRGLVIRNDQQAFVLAPDLKIPVSKSLFEQDPARGHVLRDEETTTILRCSYKELSPGQVELVPEESPDEPGALAFLDLGRGRHSSVRLSDDSQGVLCRVNRPSDTLFGTEDVALVHLLPNWPLGANRSSRRWLCFGGDRVYEVLYVRFNGQTISFDLMR